MMLFVYVCVCLWDCLCVQEAVSILHVHIILHPTSHPTIPCFHPPHRPSGFAPPLITQQGLQTLCICYLQAQPQSQCCSVWMMSLHMCNLYKWKMHSNRRCNFWGIYSIVIPPYTGRWSAYIIVLYTIPYTQFPIIIPCIPSPTHHPLYTTPTCGVYTNTNPLFNTSLQYPPLLSYFSIPPSPSIFPSPFNTPLSFHTPQVVEG